MTNPEREPGTGTRNGNGNQEPEHSNAEPGTRNRNGSQSMSILAAPFSHTYLADLCSLSDRSVTVAT